MINRSELLSDLQSLLRKLEADLLERTSSAEVPEVGEWLRAEYQKAKDAERTAHTFKQWLDDFITQVAAAWVLSCVFARFLEDNGLIDPPRLAGPGKRLEQARDEHTLFFQDPERAKLTDREYLLDLFTELAQLPAGQDLFGSHNPMNALPNWLGPDAAGELLRFFQKIDSDTGVLLHNFTDAEWDTRFLGDLYQDLSEAARKKYALLQTPDFVEEFILDRTLDPALDEFGLDAPPVKERNGKELTPAGFRMIDPACGSGHFLLGSFPRILNRWQKQEPGANVRDLVQRTLNSIHGVDINPFAIAIARFRLLLAAFKSCGIKKMDEKVGFEFHLACGDSLYHGRQRQKMFDDDWTDEAHYFRTEDVEELRRILKEGTYHAVVANPPYIVPRDKAANETYRRLYPKACHRQYSLAVPFMERILRLAVPGKNGSQISGFTGQITANSFMKREFGKKLIESWFPTINLTHVIDTSGAYIPGHGTPTVILFARNEQPVMDTLRTVMGIRGEPSTPEDPSHGLVWTAIVDQVDQPDSQSEFISTGDSSRELFHKHPWSIGGGGAAELKEHLESTTKQILSTVVDSIGFFQDTHADEAFVQPAGMPERHCLRSAFKVQVRGDNVRDWQTTTDELIFFPYDQELNQWDEVPRSPEWNWLICLKVELWSRSTFGGGTYRTSGRPWFDYHQFPKDRARTPMTITYGEVATHNHFVFDRGGKVFNRTAPVIKLPLEVEEPDGNKRPVTEDDHLALLGLLNSSTACFWMKQVCHNKGSTVDQHGARQRTSPFEDFFAFNATKILQFPLPNRRSYKISKWINARANEMSNIAPSRGHTRSKLAEFEVLNKQLRSQQIRLQEDLDWECYRLYGLLDEDLTYPVEESFGIQLGERAFEIVLARQIATGEVQTTWFERHGSTPITEIPDHWSDDYKQLVQRRIEVIEENKNIALIEQPEYKRRWNTEPWDSQVERALKSWLLDRLETYFDFDGRMAADAELSEEDKQKLGVSAPLREIALYSVAKLADIARQDTQFMEVAEVYRDDPAFDVERLVEELVKGEHVPLLPVLRYKPTGLRNRAEWERIWELQRLEDKLRAGEPVNLTDYDLTEQQCTELAAWQSETPDKQKADDRGLDPILSIPVPPKYKSSDFLSTGGARYWALRGKLDVPKERWVSFPHCEGPDGALLLAWAGYNHLQLTQAISAYFVEVQEHLGGRDDVRLIPLLAGVIELLPWLKQWHHDIDPEFNQRMDEVYEGFVNEEARALGKTSDEIKAWQPPKKPTKKTRTKN
ncbi:MAG: SAM-dependent methyltransferase [Gimesia sp.]|uniref:BREX-2 system adenine-specific DNA-methyltransferase PglX n=1 Tax=Gimesia sp. TaxID=2024833 RepID=UPI000C657537|nr:BREX-2 system adenine-specific DNA-methyltransferase PglX [Gimesia sp.]MAX35349.1 SAM-dependent methyltransferase [Gimesia sp.]